MKTRFLSIMLLILSAFQISAQEQDTYYHPHGYAWHAGVAVGATFTDNNPTAVVEVFTTHGYQFSRRIFAGAGISTYSTETLNLYLLARFNFGKIKSIESSYPYLAFRGGYSWSTWTGDNWGDDKGPIIDPMLGWSFYTPEGKLRWNVYLNPGIYQYEFIPKIGLCFEF